MAQSKSKSVQKKYTATPMVVAYLNDLKRSGLFGGSQSEVAGRLIASAIEQLIRRGTLQRRNELPADWDATDQDDADGA
jgi:hypothetical protein